ncbi:MAG: hypothetical protein ACHQWU_12505 [Gemmatimonadales bacterium]
MLKASMPRSLSSSGGPLAFTYRDACDAGHRRRLLLITYSFPPDTAVGALRWQKFSRYVAERGWGLDVITLEPSQLPRRDATGLTDLPPDVSIVGVRQRDVALSRLHRGLTALRRSMLPERSISAAHTRARPERAGAATGNGPRRRELSKSQEAWRAYLALLEYSSSRRWAHDAAKIAINRIADSPAHFAVVSSGPPHMAHEAGRLVAKRSRMPLVLDMRDPWSIDEGLDFETAGAAWYTMARYYERRAVAAASLIVANTDGARDAMVRVYPDVTHRTVTVMNGFDDDDPPPAAAPWTERFVIAFAGSIYLDRNPVTLFRALGLLVARERLTPRDIGVEFMGHVSHFGGRPVMELAHEAGVGEFVTLHEPRPRREAQAFLASAALLISLPQNSRLTVPAKIFEYMQFNSWVAALSEPRSATAELLRGTAADSVAPEDVEGLAAILAKRLAAFRRGERPGALARDPRFSRRRQADVLFDALERMAMLDYRSHTAGARAATGEATESA